MQATITGYHTHATDGEIGHVEDFMVDDENWAIRFLVVATLDRVCRRRMIMKERKTHQKEKKNGKKNGSL
jgi:hypothetical protein